MKPHSTHENEFSSVMPLVFLHSRLHYRAMVAIPVTTFEWLANSSPGTVSTTIVRLYWAGKNFNIMPDIKRWWEYKSHSEHGAAFHKSNHAGQSVMMRGEYLRSHGMIYRRRGVYKMWLLLKGSSTSSIGKRKCTNPHYSHTELMLEESMTVSQMAPYSLVKRSVLWG
jgi:hypothetical protein